MATTRPRKSGRSKHSKLPQQSKQLEQSKQSKQSKQSEHPADVALLLHLWLELPQAEDTALQRHLEGCQPCQERLAMLEYLEAEGDLDLPDLTHPNNWSDITETSSDGPTPEARAALAQALAVCLERISLESERNGKPTYPFALGREAARAVPGHLVGALEGWVNHARSPEGGDERDLDPFWYALLCGDPAKAAVCADSKQLLALGHLLRELTLYAPRECYGSSERVRRWSGLHHQ